MKNKFVCRNKSSVKITGNKSATGSGKSALHVKVFTRKLVKDYGEVLRRLGKE